MNIRYGIWKPSLHLHDKQLITIDARVTHWLIIHHFVCLNNSSPYFPAVYWIYEFSFAIDWIRETVLPCWVVVLAAEIVLQRNDRTTQSVKWIRKLPEWEYEYTFFLYVTQHKKLAQEDTKQTFTQFIFNNNIEGDTTKLLSIQHALKHQPMKEAKGYMYNCFHFSYILLLFNGRTNNVN